MRRAALLAILLAAASAFGPWAAPQDAETGTSPEEAQRLEKIRLEIESLRERLVRGESEAGTLLDQLDEIDLKMAVLGRETTLLEAQLAATRRSEEQSRLESDRARRSVAAAESRLRSWLVELYKAGPAGNLRLVLNASSPAELASAERAAEFLAQEQGRRTAQLRAEKARLDESARALQAAEQRLVGLRTDLDARRSDARSAQASRNALLSDVRARQQSGEQALMALVQVERDMKTLLEGLPEGPAGQTPSYGLPQFRGLLNWPAPGPVAIPFGNVRHPRFATEVPHPGLEIACQPGQTVRALFDGRVAFSAWFRGYGQMIVIDHGDEYLSIYGQLGERLVEAGQEVRRDQAIAVSGEQGTFGVTGLYLEVRHHGKAEDPLPWLRRDAGRRRPTEIGR